VPKEIRVFKVFKVFKEQLVLQVQQVLKAFKVPLDQLALKVQLALQVLREHRVPQAQQVPQVLLEQTAL
jgi:hypothetical protein